MSRPTSLDLAANVTARRLETSRGAFAALDAAPQGPGEPRGAALLIPGFTGSKEDFLDLLPPLTAAGFRVVTVDGRGQHESDGPRSAAAYAQSELAADITAQTAALREAYGHEGPLHVLGHSLGGHIVRAALLADGPGPYASLTLMSSGPAAIAPDQRVRTQAVVDFLPTMDMETAWKVMRAIDADGARLDEPGGASKPDGAGGPGGVGRTTAGAGAAAVAPDWLTEFLHRRWITTVPEQLIATAQQLMNEPDRVAELAAVPLPKLVLSGERDYAWPVEWMDDMAVRLGAKRVVIKGAEHSPNAERPAETAAALAAFWTGEGAAGQ